MKTRILVSMFFITLLSSIHISIANDKLYNEISGCDFEEMLINENIENKYSFHKAKVVDVDYPYVVIDLDMDKKFIKVYTTKILKKNEFINVLYNKEDKKVCIKQFN